MTAEKGPYVDPYAHPAHASWVTSGNCPAIHLTKAWCNETAGHKGAHRAPYTRVANGVISSWLYWNDGENHPVARGPS